MPSSSQLSTHMTRKFKKKLISDLKSKTRTDQQENNLQSSHSLSQSSIVLC